MRTTTASYSIAQSILDYIVKNPGCHSAQIADALNILKQSAHNNLQRMAASHVVTIKKVKHQGGARYLYTATGAPLPPIYTRRKPTLEHTEIAINIDAVPMAHHAALPSFLQAITPVIDAHSFHGQIHTGYTKEQHQLQSAIMRQERRTRGAMYTGESRL